MKKAYYITTPIYYPTDVPRIKNAYSTTVSDAYARFNRLIREKVLFTTGSDEHGLKVQNCSQRYHLTPQQFVDKKVEDFKTVWKKLYISYDKFIRTTSEEHILTVEDVFKKLYGQGDIYKGNYKGWYCPYCESFWPEAVINNGKCPEAECDGSVEEVKEENYFFRLSKYQSEIVKYIKENPSYILPEKRKIETLEILSKPLKDICITRKGLIWGIPVPIDPNFTIYVWFDALISYISGAEYGREGFSNIWPCNIHFIRGEILAYHSIIWTALCLALKISPPKQIFVFGHIGEGKRKGYQVPAMTNLVEVIDKYGSNAVRYYFLRETNPGGNLPFSEEKLIDRYNNELVYGVGNLYYRVISMIYKYTQGTIPRANKESSLEKKIYREFKQVKNEYKKYF